MNECNFVSSLSSNLRRHKSSKHAVSSKRYHCDKCDYSALHMPNLRYHKESKHGGVTVKYPCEDCDFFLRVTLTLSAIGNRSMKEFSIHVTNVIMQQQNQDPLCFTKVVNI